MYAEHSVVTEPDAKAIASLRQDTDQRCNPILVFTCLHSAKPSLVPILNPNSYPYTKPAPDTSAGELAV